MKEIFQNRTRLSPSAKIHLLGLSAKDNGLIWTALFALYYVTSAIAEKSFALADARRRHLRLPGYNSPAMNRYIWENWDWKAGGEEWTPSEDWKRSIIERILKANIPVGSVVLEVGPGAGRWTEELQRLSKHLTGIDISEACIRRCQVRFANCDNVDFRVGSGSDLNGIGDESVDAIWSFDVFVHINMSEFQCYMREFARVLKPEGTIIIQHGGVRGALGGWRSDINLSDVKDMVRKADLELIEQFSSWWDPVHGREYQAGLYGDAITVVRKPHLPARANALRLV